MAFEVRKPGGEQRSLHAKRLFGHGQELLFDVVQRGRRCAGVAPRDVLEAPDGTQHDRRCEVGAAQGEEGAELGRVLRFLVLDLRHLLRQPGVLFRQLGIALDRREEAALGIEALGPYHRVVEALPDAGIGFLGVEVAEDLIAQIYGLRFFGIFVVVGLEYLQSTGVEVEDRLVLDGAPILELGNRLEPARPTWISHHEHHIALCRPLLAEREVVFGLQRLAVLIVDAQERHVE